MKYIILVISCICFKTGYSQFIVNDPYAGLRDLPAFHAVKISGGIDLLMSKGTDQAVAISVERGSNEDVVTEVKDSVLYIHPRSGLKRFSSKTKMKAYVSYIILKKIDASGAVDVRFADIVQQERVAITLTGASSLKATINIPRLIINLSGASEVVLEGNTDDLKLVCSGASDFKSYNLNAKRSDVELSGASDARITVSDVLSANVSGASDLSFKGTPKTTLRSSGASSISQKN